jgi:hypothetical protein
MSAMILRRRIWWGWVERGVSNFLTVRLQTLQHGISRNNR